MTRRYKFNKKRLLRDSHQTIPPNYDDIVEYNSQKTRQIYLSLLYPNPNLIPKLFWCDNPVCKNKLKWEQMQIHHVLPIRLAPQLRYDVNNMLLLCPNCHHIIHAPTEEVID
jgi:5-methylcytosine-specific restriction endonuclease McrA